MTSYQVYGLKRLSAYRKKFYGVEPNSGNKSVSNTIKRQKLIQEFIYIFCEHNFADTDYTVIQNEPLEFDTMDEWIQQASISSLLKSLTYFIWTDKIVEGYFNGRIENRTIEKILLRIEAAIREENMAV